MIHIMDGEWEYKNIGPSKINVSKIFSIIKYKKIQPIIISIDEIAYKSLDNIDINSIRYKIADTNFPLIVVENMVNPYNKKYRMIDGRHRLKKYLNNEHSFELTFYVLGESDILPYIEKI